MTQKTEQITQQQVKDSLIKAIQQGDTLENFLQENSFIFTNDEINKTQFLLDIAKELPELKTKALKIIKADNKAIINNTDNFLFRMKDNDPNKYYKCNVFMQDNSNKIATPLNIPRGTLSYIGAMTHRGKTTALISILLDAIKQGQNTYFITTEETPEQIFIRMIKAILLQNYSNVLKHNDIANYYYLENCDDIDERIRFFMGKYTPALIKTNPESFEDAIYKSYEILTEYLQKELFTIIDHTQQRSFEELITTIETLENKSLLVLDYIQHVKKPANSGSDNRQVIIQNQSQRLADIAGHKDLIIIAGGQFNRKGNEKDKEQDKFKPDFLDPTLFRESGDIEQDANLIIGIGQQMHEKEIIRGQSVTRFYEILKYRNHKPDSNKYEIVDNSAFSLYSCNNKNGHLQYFESLKPETKRSKKEPAEIQRKDIEPKIF